MDVRTCACVCVYACGACVSGDNTREARAGSVSACARDDASVRTYVSTRVFVSDTCTCVCLCVRCLWLCACVGCAGVSVFMLV